MDYAFEKLQMVRSLREQLAQSDLARGRHRLDQAARNLSRKRRDLECCRLFKSEMEIRLFEEMDRREVTRNEFQSYCGRISDLRVEEEKCRERVRLAESQKDSARKEVDHLSAVFRKRSRESTRLKEFRSTLNTMAEEENNRRMEEEMDEMVLNRFFRSEAGG